jgi:hypothetical protein
MASPVFLSESYTTLNLNANQQQTYDNINRKRLDIQRQMLELNQENGSYYEIQRADYETTILAGVLWAMLATGTIYYVFSRV